MMHQFLINKNIKTIIHKNLIKNVNNKELVLGILEEKIKEGEYQYL